MSRKRAGSSSAPATSARRSTAIISSSTMRFAVERYTAALDANEMLRSAAQLDDVRPRDAPEGGPSQDSPAWCRNWAEAILPDVWRQPWRPRGPSRRSTARTAGKGPLRRYLCPKDLHALALTCKRLHRIAREQTRVLLIWSRAAPLGSSDWRETDAAGLRRFTVNARRLDPLRSLPRCTLVMIDCMRSTSGWHRQAMLHMLLQQVDLSKCVLGFDGVECMNHRFAATWLPHAALVRAFRTFLFTDISALVLFVQDFCVGDMPPVTLLYAGDVPPVTLMSLRLGTVLVDRVCLCGAADRSASSTPPTPPDVWSRPAAPHGYAQPCRPRRHRHPPRLRAHPVLARRRDSKRSTACSPAARTPAAAPG